MEYLRKQAGNYRTLPLSGEPMPYSAQKIPVLFTSSPVQQQRWQEFLDNFGFGSPMLDIMNVKYLVMTGEQYGKDFKPFGERFVPVFSSPDGAELVVENRHVLPKGWLVPSVVQVPEGGQALAIIQNPAFDARSVAVVETPPPISLDPAGGPVTSAGDVVLQKYSGEELDFKATVTKNALLVTGEKYANGWKALVDGKPAVLARANYVLRGVYLTPGTHEVRFVFDPLSFKVGKWLTLGSFGFFVVMLGLEWRRWRREREG
jgi:hypothetical protein